MGGMGIRMSECTDNGNGDKRIYRSFGTGIGPHHYLGSVTSRRGVGRLPKLLHQILIRRHVLLNREAIEITQVRPGVIRGAAAGVEAQEHQCGNAGKS